MKNEGRKGTKERNEGKHIFIARGDFLMIWPRGAFHFKWALVLH